MRFVLLKRQTNGESCLLLSLTSQHTYIDSNIHWSFVWLQVRINCNYSKHHYNKPTDNSTYNAHTQPFKGLWSRTTWVSWYQNKYSPTHTHPDHQTSFIKFLHLPQHQDIMHCIVFTFAGYKDEKNIIIANTHSIEQYHFSDKITKDNITADLLHKISIQNHHHSSAFSSSFHL